VSVRTPKARHGKMVGLVETILTLHKDLPKAKTPQEQESLQRQIAATDKAIDSLVYELYGLTEDEANSVEGVDGRLVEYGVT
jgi:hypothetical protein